MLQMMSCLAVIIIIIINDSIYPAVSKASRTVISPVSLTDKQRYRLQ